MTESTLPLNSEAGVPRGADKVNASPMVNVSNLIWDNSEMPEVTVSMTALMTMVGLTRFKASELEEGGFVSELVNLGEVVEGEMA